MEPQSLLNLVLAIILCIISSWSLSTFLRLQNAATKLNSNKELNDKCNVTESYLKTGRTIAIVLIVLSVIAICTSSFWFIRSLHS